MSDSNHQHHKAACQELFARLSEYLDDEMEASLRRTMEQHLDQCRSCRVCLATLQRTVALCRDIGTAPLPGDVSMRLKQYFSALGKKPD